jgi:hypothetical protein
MGRFFLVFLFMTGFQAFAADTAANPPATTATKLEVRVGFENLDRILLDVKFLDGEAILKARSSYAPLVNAFNALVSGFNQLPEPDRADIRPTALRVQHNLGLLYEMIAVRKPVSRIRYTPLFLNGK